MSNLQNRIIKEYIDIFGNYILETDNWLFYIMSHYGQLILEKNLSFNNKQYLNAER